MPTETLMKPESTPPRERAVTPSPAASPPAEPEYGWRYLVFPVEYPDSDGQPMAESDFQREPLLYAVESLDIRFQDRPDVYVTGNIFLYFHEGDPTDVVSPDVFVVFGAEKRKRRSYKIWEEPKPPDFVLEITSNSSRIKDQGTKKGLYEYLGIAEYFCYDPTGDYLDPPLIGYRLEGNLYVPIPPKELSPSTIIVPSQSLGLDLRVANRDFRFVDPATGLVLFNLAEAEQQRGEEQRLREQEHRERLAAEQRTAEAEAKVRELEAQVAALKQKG